MFIKGRSFLTGYVARRSTFKTVEPVKKNQPVQPVQPVTTDQQTKTRVWILAASFALMFLK